MGSKEPINWLVKFHLDLYSIKIINIFNGVPKSKLREIKILMGINQNMGENDLEGGSSQFLILAIDYRLNLGR